MLLSNNRFSIGEFKTAEDIKKLPLKYYWNLEKDLSHINYKELECLLNVIGIKVYKIP